MRVLVIPANDLLGEPGLKLAQRECGVLVGVVGAPGLGRSAGGAWQALELAHLRADQPLDVATVVRAFAVDELDAVLATAALECLALEFSRLRGCNCCCRQARTPQGRADQRQLAAQCVPNCGAGAAQAKRRRRSRIQGRHSPQVFATMPRFRCQPSRPWQCRTRVAAAFEGALRQMLGAPVHQHCSASLPTLTLALLHTLSMAMAIVRRWPCSQTACASWGGPPRYSDSRSRGK